MNMLAKTMANGQNESGPGGATNAITGPKRQRTVGGSAMPPDGDHYTFSGDSGKPEQSAVLSPDDIRRCRAINMRHRDRVKEIALAVSAETTIPISAIYSQSRLSPVVQARDLVAFIARGRGLTLEAIGRALNRDHSTIRHAIMREQARRGER